LKVEKNLKSDQAEVAKKFNDAVKGVIGETKGVNIAVQ
jgi:hypothetical protein